MEKIFFPAILAVTLFLAASTSGLAQDHLKDLDNIRSSLTEIGNKLPGIIGSAAAEDVRTLERVFEINNYALMTIESYLKMLKVTVVSGGKLNKAAVSLVNTWLRFIANYCENDTKYLDEALKDTKDGAASDIVSRERNCIFLLQKAATKGIEENSSLAAD